MVLTKLLRNGDYVRRTYEQKLMTLEDLRQAIKHLEHSLNQANSEGKECYVEIWMEYHDSPSPELAQHLSKGG